jgi:hypothetical protein
MSKKYQPPFSRRESFVDFTQYEELAMRAEFVEDRSSSFVDRPIYSLDVYTTLA